MSSTSTPRSRTSILTKAVAAAAALPLLALLPAPTASATTTASTTIRIKAHTTTVSGTGATMQLWVKGRQVAQTTLSNTTDKTLTFTAPGRVLGTDQIDVAFTNDLHNSHGDRNLYVTSVTVGSSLLSPARAVYDLGTTRATMTDGRSTRAGTSAVSSNGALRWNLPATTKTVTSTTTPTATTPSVAKPATVTNSVTRPSRMPWDSGAFTEEKAGVATSFAAQRGAALDVWSTFADSSSKSAESSTWWLDNVPSGFTGTLSIGVPLWSRDTTVADAANGGMDQTWRSIAQGLVKGGYANSYVRLGWEMNLPGSNGREATAANQAQWTTAFRRAASIFRAASPSMRIVFNPNLGSSQTGVEANQVYPGDAYVDVVGVDVYDWWPAFTNDSAMSYHQTGSYGLDYWLDFAKSHGKRFALPEWAVSDENSNAGGDNPRFVDYMYGWMQKNASTMAYESWYDESSDGCGCSLSPQQNAKASAEYNTWIAKLRG